MRKAEMFLEIPNLTISLSACGRQNQEEKRETMAMMKRKQKLWSGSTINSNIS